MPPHPLANFEIQKYYQNEPKFNGAYLTMYIINLDEYESIETHWIRLDYKIIRLELSEFQKKL